jgi:hypothetical protein
MTAIASQTITGPIQLKLKGNAHAFSDVEGDEIMAIANDNRRHKIAAVTSRTTTGD